MKAQLLGGVGLTEANKITKLMTLVICMLMTVVNGQSCSSITINNQTTCNLCTQNNYFFNCTKLNSSGILPLNEADCISQCCYASSTANSTQVSVCKSSKATTIKSSADAHTTVFILIIVFTGLGVFCCYCTCNYCLKKIRQIKLNNEDPDRKINLDTFKIDELGPYYLQKQQNCSICLQDKCDVLTICKHYYHIECLSVWVKKIRKCPMCVSTQINPIIYYCTKCSISVNLGVLVLNQGDEQVNQEMVVCKECKKDKYTQNCEPNVSLSIQDEAQKKEKQNNQIDRIQSSQGIVVK